MKILIVEDEKSIARRTERLLREILGTRLSDLNIRSNVAGGLDFINHNEIDVLFLDLNLSGGDGFDILKTVVAESFDTIIVSAYRSKAIEAFEYGVVDFVPKPYDKLRLEKALSRLDLPRAEAKNIVIKKQGLLKVIAIEKIVYFKGANIYSEIYIDDQKKELTEKTLENLSKMLPPHFERIHKSYIVDMNRAEEIIIQPGSKYELRLNNDIILPIGRTKYKELKERYFST